MSFFPTNASKISLLDEAVANPKVDAQKLMKATHISLVS